MIMEGDEIVKWKKKINRTTGKPSFIWKIQMAIKIIKGCLCVGHCFVHWYSSPIVLISLLDHMPFMVSSGPLNLHHRVSNLAADTH